MPTQLELFPTSKEEVEYQKEYNEWLDAMSLTASEADDLTAFNEASLEKSESFNWQKAIDDPDKPF